MAIRALTALAVLATISCGQGDQRDVGLERTARRDIHPPDTTAAATNEVPPTAAESAAPSGAAPSVPESTPKHHPKSKAAATAPKGADTAPLPVGTPSAGEVAAVVTKLGLSVYPARGQSKEQQARDERRCYAWAHSQTGIDPMAVAANPDSAAKAGTAAAESATAGAGARGAGRGAAGGAIVGAIAGNAGAGAAVGAATGAAAGRRTKKQAEQQAGQQAGQQAEAQAAQMTGAFTKAMSACLEGKGYSTK